VYLDEKLLSLVPPPDKGELDMLDLAYEPKMESRLGCQIRLTRDLLQQIEDDDFPIVVTIPADVNNVWT
jgi:ferredoxin